MVSTYILRKTAFKNGDANESIAYCSGSKKKIKDLQEYVRLAEEYPEETLQQQILKLYAFTGSIKEVVTELNIEREKQQRPSIDGQLVSETIQSKPADPLHKLLRTNNLTKTKHIRKKLSN
ncbi:hypothetical protein [Planococcus shixiaomingii]|uniref:hypothetical protein n=1 Tax=Planococcus shixiaomingii TaxID=3058393 RepID=UPI002658FBA7|nr:hypothetical protein [Planococcus sp. N028]